MTVQKLFGISIENQTKDIVLDKIKKVLGVTHDFYHVISLNPENIVVAYESREFMEIVRAAQIKIVDGVGVVVTGRLLGIDVGQRVTGVSLMQELVKLACKRSLRVMLIGGKANLADKLANCYNQQSSSSQFIGIEGIKNIKSSKKEEEDRIFSIVMDFKPHLLFVAFGSPMQEVWLWRNRTRLKGIICMGVGGAFDFLSGHVIRAPGLVRKIGLEWFFRLVLQPWRFKRQLRLFKYLWLVVVEKFK